MRALGVSLGPNKRPTDGHVSDKLFFPGLGFLNVVRRSGGLELRGKCVWNSSREAGGCPVRGAFG